MALAQTKIYTEDDYYSLPENTMTCISTFSV